MIVKKSNIGGRNNLREINPAWFTGKTWIKSMSDTIGTAGQDIYHVHFEVGSRTKLHSHDGDQILIVTCGKGSLVLFEADDMSQKDDFQIKKTKTIGLAKGDMVNIPKGVLHTHGSTDPTETFSHVAVNILPRKNAKYKTTWYESDLKSRVYSII